jgi:hypothetical protein
LKIVVDDSREAKMAPPRDGQKVGTSDTEIVSPDWHTEVLAERERLISSGEETYIDWEIAKKQLRAELP